MSVPDQEVLDGIKDLISEVTGFKENDENFAICERYCLSHVVHHMYPFVSKTTVKNLINSYVSRFYGHGYFRVSQELNTQIKSFLSNEKLFEKNPQYDIQWCLLSLLSSLSSNLTSVKKLPELLPIEDDENESENFDWKEYLMSDLPEQTPLFSSDEDLSRDDDEEESGEEVDDESFKEGGSADQNSAATTSIENSCQDKKNIEIIFDNKNLFNTGTSSEIRQKRIEEFMKSRKSKRDLEMDLRRRGNITEKFDSLINQSGIVKKFQMVSEFEMMENILFQFQTGERILLRKGLLNPALTSLTEDTLGDYLESLQPYFKIIRSFREFDCEVTEARYSQKSLDVKFTPVKGSQSSTSINSADSSKKNIPSVLYMYNVALRKALEPFQKELTEIVQNMGSHTLIQMERKLQPHYFDLTSLFSIHNAATKSWKNECNWISSVRILSVLYTAIMDATSARMSFLYLNFFLHCFQVYLDVIDSWISFHDLIDPNDEFIVTKSDGQGRSENKCSEYEIRPYKKEIESVGVKNVVILDLISEKMIQVGQSLEVLLRLNRFATQEAEASKETFYHLLVKSVNEKVLTLGNVDSIPKPLRVEKPKSIFTVKNTGLGLERDNGGGDSCDIGNLLAEILKDGEDKNKQKVEPKEVENVDTPSSYCVEFIYSMVRNPFFKAAFDTIGMKQVQKQLEEAKRRLKEDSRDEALMVVKKPDEGKSGIYPLHKIVTEAFHKILGNRISGACALVKDIVLNECNLPRHLSLLRSILLFNDSYLIQPFILAVFTQPVIWGSSYSLSLHMKECVRSYYKEYANALSVILIKNGSTKCENVLQVIDSITVTYEVTWPLTLIITPEAMRKYNEIFRLALKLKWAHWALCGRHFKEDKDDGCSNSTRHRLRLLRFWLLSTLGRINNYFLTRMTPPDLELNSCNDLKEIIHEHSEFLEKIHHNCLLGERSPEGRKLIMETLITLCMDVLVEGGNVDDAKLSEIEMKFGDCHLLLSHLLSSLEK